MAYQPREPWQEFAQLFAEASQPTLDTTFVTPFWCVAGFAVVVLYPVPWQVAQLAKVCREWRPVEGGMPWQVLHDCVGGVQLWVRTGVPAQPAGEDDTTVRVCVPLAEQALHGEYVYVQAGGV